MKILEARANPDGNDMELRWRGHSFKEPRTEEESAKIRASHTMALELIAGDKHRIIGWETTWENVENEYGARNKAEEELLATAKEWLKKNISEEGEYLLHQATMVIS